MGIYQKLFAFYQRFEKIRKDLDIPADGNKTYGAVSENMVLEKVRPILDELKLIVYLEEITRVERTGETTTVAGNYKWVDVETGESVVMASGGQGSSKRDKGFGMALTYSQKYLFLKFGKTATGDDPDKTSDYQHEQREIHDDQIYNGCMNLLDEMKGAQLKTEHNYTRIRQAILDNRGNEQILTRAYNTLVGVKEGKVDPGTVAVQK